MPPKSGEREVKMNLSYELLLNLHGCKILRGQTISHVVSTALREYFQREGWPARSPPNTPPVQV